MVSLYNWEGSFNIMLLKKQAFFIKHISEQQLIFCGVGDSEPMCDEILYEKLLKELAMLNPL